MNRRNFVTAFLATLLPGYLVAQEPIRATQYAWVSQYFDYDRQHGTALQITLPDGTMVRNAVRSLRGKNIRDIDEAWLIEQEKGFLIEWALNRYNVIVPTN